MCSSFSRSPSMSLVTGIPVQRADDPGDLLIGDTVMQEVRFPFGLFSEFLLLFQFLLELGQTAILEFRRLVEVVFHLGLFRFRH